MAAPRAFLLIGGDSADGERSWPYVDAALPVWKLTGAPEAVGLFNHRRGHTFAPQARAARGVARLVPQNGERLSGNIAIGMPPRNNARRARTAVIWPARTWSAPC